MGNTKTQEIRRENVNHSLVFQNLHNSRVGNHNLFEEHYQNLPLDLGMNSMVVINRGGKQ